MYFIPFVYTIQNSLWIKYFKPSETSIIWYLPHFYALIPNDFYYTYAGNRYKFNLFFDRISAVFAYIFVFHVVYWAVYCFWRFSNSQHEFYSILWRNIISPTYFRENIKRYNLIHTYNNIYTCIRSLRSRAPVSILYNTLYYFIVSFQILQKGATVDQGWRHTPMRKKQLPNHTHVSTHILNNSKYTQYIYVCVFAFVVIV